MGSSWRSSGSGADAGPVQQAVEAQQMRVDEAWRAYTGHTRKCTPCATGIDCAKAQTLKAVWRATKAT
ncbi:hypothetical protein [Streptomyces fuscigenes]|uniref:hypothetical protein n=1 Tax=Streptomyces fuscigenes TaxID=1528880 RepID=UPI001F26544D|nr:hypothetical protein [Streptomyces fuscigenes]MCF3960460.1 hypothetical protein [Streptomyces fuscigenes]